MMGFWDVAADFFKNLFSFDQAHPLLFTQFYFWAFFAIVLAFLCVFRNKVLLRNAFLFFVSLFFYYKTSGLFLILLVFVIVFNYLSAFALPCVKRNFGRKVIVVLSVVVDLSLLCYYKYSYFLTDVVNNMFGTGFVVKDWFAVAGNQLTGSQAFSVDSIFLPVGISFFIFQAVSYVVDVSRGTIAPIRNFWDFGFYLSFFPPLVAGPIVRAKEFVSQLRQPFFLGRRQFGVAMLMGFYLPKNFNSPYKARNAGEFWKRWHISLSKWLQDYLYIPLGGNRNGTFGSYAIILGIAFLASALAKNWWVFGVVLAIAVVLAILIAFCRKYRKELISDINRMDTMLLGGLWHGASWNFMIWGGLNGLGMLIYRFWKSCNVYVRTLVTGLVCLTFYILKTAVPASVFNMFFVWTLIIFIGAAVRMLYYLCRFKAAFSWLETGWAVAMTFIFITFTRLFFRSGSNLNPAEANEKAWSTAKNMVERIGGDWDMSLIPQMARQHLGVILVFVVGMIIHWLPENFKRRYRLWFASMPLPLMALVCVLAVFIICQFITADLQSFIYFQF